MVRAPIWVVIDGGMQAGLQATGRESPGEAAEQPLSKRKAVGRGGAGRAGTE